MARPRKEGDKPTVAEAAHPTTPTEDLGFHPAPRVDIQAIVAGKNRPIAPVHVDVERSHNETVSELVEELVAADARRPPKADPALSRTAHENSIGTVQRELQKTAEERVAYQRRETLAHESSLDLIRAEMSSRKTLEYSGGNAGEE